MNENMTGKDETIYVVSGLPRSGTSMLMKMLHAGGIEPLTDEKREPDEDNPKGYYEYEKVLKIAEDNSWLADAKGKSVKILADLVQELPPEYQYKVFFIERDLSEIIASQNKMLERQGKDTSQISDEEMYSLFRVLRTRIKGWLSTQGNVNVLYLSYNDIMATPEIIVNIISGFVGRSLDEEEMMRVIDPKLYRNRN